MRLWRNRGNVLPIISKKYEQVNILDDGVKHTQSIFKGWEIHCLICGLTIFHINKIDAIKAWNTRSSPKGEGEIEEMVGIMLSMGTPDSVEGGTNIHSSEYKKLAGLLALSKPTGLVELDVEKLTKIISSHCCAPDNYHCEPKDAAEEIASQFGTREVRLPEIEEMVSEWNRIWGLNLTVSLKDLRKRIQALTDVAELNKKGKR